MLLWSPRRKAPANSAFVRNEQRLHVGVKRVGTKGFGSQEGAEHACSAEVARRWCRSHLGVARMSGLAYGRFICRLST